jgi:hypothetical protein
MQPYPPTSHGSFYPEPKENKLFIEVCKKGTFYFPAWKHYGKPSTTVICDRCGSRDLKACVGLLDKDLCMTCVHKITSQATPEISHSKMLGMEPAVRMQSRSDMRYDVTGIGSPVIHGQAQRESSMFSIEPVSRMDYCSMNSAELTKASSERGYGQQEKSGRLEIDH